MQIILLLSFLIPAILFIFTQQNTLKVIRPENRELHPGMVWLQLIPLFNFYWIFVVVTRIADSINKENLALQDDTILGIPDYDAVKAVGKRPTYKIGITYCITALLGPLFTIFVNLFGNELTPDFYQVFMTILGGLSLAAMTCWIIYWVKLAANKRKLMYLHA